MNSFKLTQLAKTDLIAIAKFSEKRWGRKQRNSYIKQFDETFHMLAGSPLVGKTCDFVSTSYHKYPQGSHIIFYKISSADSIDIIRILHKNMDVESKFKSD